MISQASLSHEGSDEQVHAGRSVSFSLSAHRGGLDARSIRARWREWPSGRDHGPAHESTSSELVAKSMLIFIGTEGCHGNGLVEGLTLQVAAALEEV